MNTLSVRYLCRCVHIWPQVSANRRSAEAAVGLLPLPLSLPPLFPLLHLLQLCLLVTVLQVLHQNGYHHVDQHELSR